MIRNSPLRLKELVFPQVSVKALVPKEPENASRELALENLDIGFAYDVDADAATVSAGLKVATKEQPVDAADHTGLYEIQVEAFGTFEIVGPEHQDPMAQYLRQFAAAAALIGAAREQVAMMTARGPWGVCMLPIISMDKVVGLPPKKQETAGTPVAVAAQKPARKRKTTTP